MAENHSQENKRIAKNTIVVYVRLFLATIIGLFTSRLVLQVLGISDYGLYNVVGGVIAFFSVIAGALSGTTIRFLNVELGKPDGNPNRLFNICNVAHIVTAVAVLVAAETIGIFYILNYLKVAPGKEADAMFVFQVSTIVSCIGIINVPYQNVFVAKEKFMHIAAIDITNSLIKLGLVIALIYYTGNALRLYALIMSVATLVSFVAYHYLCYRYWPELVRWKFVNRKSQYKELMVYNNYNLLAAVAQIGRSQGSNVLINFFFGTVVNGAYGIMRTIEGFVVSFTVSFDSAAAPQITQNVGKGDLDRATYIAGRSCRLSQLLCLLVIFPLFAEMELLLRLWLGTVPEYTVLFCRVMLIAIYISSTGGGLMRLKDALGKIKWFMLTYSFWHFLTLPVGYYLFKIGYPPVTILILFVICDTVCRITQLILMKLVYDYNIIPFCKDAYNRPFIILSLMIVYLIFYIQLALHGFVVQSLGLTVTLIVGGMLIFFIGLQQSEQKKCFSFIQNKLQRLM